MWFAFLAGCPEPLPLDLHGIEVWRMFPFDGERQTTFTSTDPEVGYRLVATCTGDAEVVGDVRTYRVHYDTEDGDPMFELVWSSDTVNGVLVHEIDGVPQVPAVPVAADDMLKDDQVAGGDWTSTFHGTVPCPSSTAGGDCGELEVVHGPGMGGGSLAGTWWATAGFGVVAFTPDGGAARWELTDFVCAGDCDGEW